jgi:ketosteroid isomerase-like protein
MTMNSDANAKELVQLEERYWQAIKDRDAQTCADLSADPCLVTGPQGVGSLTKAQMKEMTEKQAQYTLENFKLKDVKTLMPGPDMGVVAYTVHQELTVDGKPVALDCSESSTWVRRGGKWECAMHSEALLGDPFGRDKAAKKA